MYLFCSKCQTQFPATSRCPRCSSRLLAPAEAADSLSVTVAIPPQPLQSTLTGRIMVGSILALGLHLALREWGAAVGLFDDSISETGYLAGYFLRIAAAMVGGVFAGAGRSRAFSGGATVGLISGAAWLVVDSFPHLRLDALNIGLMIALVSLAGCCALMGGRIWPAVVEMRERRPNVGRGVRERVNSSVIRMEALKAGMRTLRQDGWLKVLSGNTTMDEVGRTTAGDLS